MKKRKEVREVLTFRGNRDLWIDFVAKIKKERKEVWDVLGEMIKKYLKNDKRIK